MVRRIRAEVEDLPVLPEAAGMLAERERPDLRQIFVGSYRVIYRIDWNRLYVVAVLHGARESRPEMMGEDDESP
jgi:plasmid stabilization system protein ParE